MLIYTCVASHSGMRGLKSIKWNIFFNSFNVASHSGMRGLKSSVRQATDIQTLSHPTQGCVDWNWNIILVVLASCGRIPLRDAWIEIWLILLSLVSSISRIPLRDAWIEMTDHSAQPLLLAVASHSGMRGLKSSMSLNLIAFAIVASHSGMRGLKFLIQHMILNYHMSHPTQGCVDWNSKNSLFAPVNHDVASHSGMRGLK